ncbi:MAG: 16S rRNA (adenine(1518)-N(6)/adenine(1519)-N(6))-dimethyltransferase RsmA [Candidatus Omnitrophica bacterium]|nr:16S rRNA (adenine(1518)-N(6)/adenine(1519)-N(6))-dimethyltransferase RsmA [Candidatus Omnitrophota bacterium]
MYVKPKKGLGQHFLIDRNIQNKIITACEFNPSDIVLEIGAGRGELTCQIAKKVKSLYAIELDKDLCTLLKKNLKDYSNTKVIRQDILRFNFQNFLNKIEDKIKVIGNIPYYITTPIIEQLFKYKEKIKDIFITVQEEFAKRMISQPGSRLYGALSCFVQYYSEPEILFKIKKTSFFPKPKIDSSFIRLKFRAYPIMVNDESFLLRIIRTAFNYRRKMLKNSLKDLIPEEKLQQFFIKYNINPSIRAEKLSLKDFINLINFI